MNFTQFEEKVGFTFDNKALLKQAFTHRSYINENKKANLLGHNERLEFLGDAVLELVITEFLYAKYPNKPEGELTAYRAALVNTQSISDAATKLGMNDYLLLSKGEANDTGRARHYILANTFEAFIGALHLDQGFSASEKFIGDNLFYKVDEVVAKRLWQDPKSNFQESAQEEVSVTPSYKLLSSIGPDHNKVFTCGVFLDDVEIAQGTGNSKQEAQQDAAKNALEIKGW